MRLFRAAARGDLASASLAVAAGADVNARDYNDQTALQIAYERNHLDLVSHLLDLGATSDCEGSIGAAEASPCQNNGHCSAASAIHHGPCQAFRRCLSHAPQKGTSNAEIALGSNFPAHIVSAMMRTERVAALHMPSVSIAFLDVADFAVLRGSLAPTALCGLLERLFAVLDALAAEHGVERIDTIDGCYIAAANCSAPQPADHAVRLARFAAAAVAAAPSLATDLGLGPVGLLGGMHCGAVCGSVVGAHGGRKHTLHGDAVNVASRMQSHGAAGAVQCSAAAAALIEAQGGGASGLRLTEREGGVEVKSLGRVRTCWVSAAVSPDLIATCDWTKATGPAEAACPCGPAGCGSPRVAPRGCGAGVPALSCCE